MLFSAARRWIRRFGAQATTRAQRARDATEWDAAHGAEREAQHTALVEERPIDFYWALAFEIGRRPKWQLRKGECLEDDLGRMMARSR